MGSSTRDNTKRKRAQQTGTLIGVRLQPEGLAALDQFIAQSPQETTRPEAIRALMEDALSAKGKKKPAPKG